MVLSNNHILCSQGIQWRTRLWQQANKCKCDEPFLTWISTLYQGIQRDFPKGLLGGKRKIDDFS